MRKGQMHVMDAIAAVLVLLFFAVSNFNPSISNDWTSYENKIAATDLSYTLEKSGNIENFIQRGETGSLKTAFDGISERDLDMGGEVLGVPPNLEIGYYTLSSDIKYASISRIESSDPCYSQVQNQLRPKSRIDILKTDSGGLQGVNDGITLYIGNYRDGEAFGSDFDFDTVWVDRGDNCNFPNANDPVRIDDNFKWGNSPDRYYQFRNAEVDGGTWQGTLKLVEASQIRRLEKTMNKPVSGINNRVDVKAFNFSSNNLNQKNIQQADLIIFPGNESIQSIQATGNVQNVKQLANNKPVLFAANLNRSLVDGGLLGDLGFSWKDLRYEDQQPEANCGLDGPHRINDCGSLSIGFTGTGDSQSVKDDVMGQKTDLEGVSMHPPGSVVVEGKGALTSEKTVYLENYAYNEIGQDRVSKSMASVSPGGRPSTHCNNVTSADFDFPNEDGDIKTLTVVNTQLGSTDSYCDRNNRALYIDRDDDSDYDESNEGPLQDGEIVEIRGLEYTVDIIPPTASGCSIGECVGFLISENAQLDIFPYNSNRNVGLAGYENTYSSTDRKVLSAFIYMMAGPSEVKGDSEGTLPTNLYGSTDHEAYQLKLRWKN